MNNDTTGSTEAAQTEVGIQILADPTVSYASYQNNVPLLRGLTVINVTNEPLGDIEVALRCEPEFADAMRLQFER